MAVNERTGDASRFRNGLPAEATLEDKKAFVVHCAKNYQTQNWKGDSLSEYFADDFLSYSVEDFAGIDSDTRRNLRDLLRQRGVYVPKGRNIIIAQALHQVTQDEIPWPENDPDKPPSAISNLITHEEDPASGRETIPDGNPGNAPAENHDATPVPTDNRSGHDENNPRPIRRGNMANLFKAYSNDEDKYSGSTTDHFERKFMLFLERCDQGDIVEEDIHRAFSIMLIGNARQYYFDSLKSKNLDLIALEKAVKTRFQTPGRTRALLREWDLLTLNSIIISNSSTSPSACLEILIKKLSDIQTSLPNEYRNETILRNKLLNVVRDVESCQLAYHKPADTIQGVISDLHASLATFKNSTNISSGPSADLYDRRYVNDGENKKPRGPSLHQKCFVCKLRGCWSTNHTSKERMKSYRGSTVLRQFVATQNPDEESDPEERETADALDDVIAHIIEIGQHDDYENEEGSSDRT